jgi:hypothetical protein
MESMADVKPAMNKQTGATAIQFADEDKNVVCKMYVKGKPNNLIEIIKNVLAPLNTKTSGGYYSDKDTPEYSLTFLVEKVK